MPVLKSPIVKRTNYSSGTVCFEQSPMAAKDAYETDVGINDRTGLNIISSRIELSNHACCNPETSLNMTICLSESWDEKDAFIKDMKDTHNVDVRHEVNAFCPTMSRLKVTGLKSIETLAGVFRDTLFETNHEGATIARQMVNPALLGEALDAAQDIVDEYKGREIDYTRSYPTYGWRA